MTDEQDDPLQKAIDAAKSAQGDPLEAAIAAARKKKPRGYRTPEQIARLNKVEMAAAREPSMGPFQTVAGGLQAAGQGFTLGFGDEIAAALRAPFRRGGYKENLADVREEREVFSREHPAADIALQMAGGALGAKGPIKGRGFWPGAGNAAILGGTAGAGYADGDLGDRAVGAMGGAVAGPLVAGTLAGGGALIRGTGRALRRVTAKPTEKALAYLQKLAAARAGGDIGAGLSATARDIAEAEAAGGSPILAEGLGESGLRALQATTTAPLSQAGEITRTALGARGQTVLPRADAAALKAVGLKPEPSGVRGPEYINDWLNAIRTDATRPLYRQAASEAARKEAAPSMAQAAWSALMGKASVPRLPAPGQSVITAQELAQKAAREPKDVGASGMVAKQVADADRASLRAILQSFRESLYPKTEPQETVAQRMAREALEGRWKEAGLPSRSVEGVPPPRRIVLRAANDIGVRNPEYVAPPVSAPSAPNAIDEVRGLIGENREVRSLVQMLESDPKKAYLMENPTSYDAMEALYHAANARIRDLTGGTARSRVQEQALKNIAASLLRGMEEIAPTSRAANKAFAALSQPQESFAFGRAFDKETPEAIDKAIQTGFLPDGTKASIESVRLGVIQRLREILVKRAGSQVLAGAAKGKDVLAGLNNEQLNRQLKVALGDKYDEMVPVIRQLLREEGTRMYATGGKNVAEGVIPEGANLADVFGAFSGGLGFGAQAAARRTAAAALKGGIKEKIAMGFGKGADARAQMLTSQGQTLSDWLAKAARPRVVPLEEILTKAVPTNRITQGILTGMFGNK